MPARYAANKVARYVPIRKVATMKLLLGIALSTFFHPIAMVLCWVDSIRRGDLSTVKKLVCLLTTFIWRLGPILYLLVTDGAMF